MDLQKGFIEMIDTDIQRIEKAIISETAENIWLLFREVDAKYQSCIIDFYKGMWQSVPNKNYLVFPELKKHPNQVMENLKIAKSKLEVFRYQGNAAQTSNALGTHVNVTTNVNVNVSFEQVRSQIEDMTSLTDQETEEIKQRVNELEKIINGEGKKKNKWEKAKPILIWLAEKSFDIGMTILPLFMKMQV